MTHLEELLLKPLLSRTRGSGSELALCVNNEGLHPRRSNASSCTGSPQIQMRPKHQQIRIVDESGEGYIYPMDYFTLVTLPPWVVRRSLEQAIA
jgi:hypothetical protein